MKKTNVSLGQYLKEHRELKGLTIDEAAMETNIAKKYIEALEQDEYGFFPAEMYITGFLTAYIEILELDKELVLSMYRRHVNKEQESPLEDFYEFQSTNNQLVNKKYVRLAILALLFVGIVGIIYTVLSSHPDNLNQQPVAKVESNNIHQLSLEDLQELNTMTVGVRDTIVVMDTDNQKLLAIEFIGKEANKKIVNFRINQNRYAYKNGDILETDIDNDGVNDLRLEIISVNARDVEINIQYTKKAPVQESFFNVEPFRNSIRTTVPVATVTNVRTFNVSVVANRPLWIAYQVDTVEEKEKLLAPNEKLSFSFVDGVKLSLGNAGAATISFSEFTNVVRGGIAGESSQSIFYKKVDGDKSTLYRSQLK